MLSILPAMEVLITNDRTGFEIVCAQHWEKNVNWVFQDVSKVPCEIRESNTGLTSIEIGISRQHISRFCSWAIGWTWWGSRRARTWRITSMLWRLRPVHKRHISARRHSGYWRIYGLVCVCLGWDGMFVSESSLWQNGAMDAERWRQRGLQLIYLSNPRHNRIGSHFCMYSCSPSSGALDSRVDPIDQESILGLDAREMNPMVSDHKALSSTILLWCNGLVPTCMWPSHSSLESPRFAAWLGRKENKQSFCYGLGWEWAQKQNISEFQLANTA